MCGRYSLHKDHPIHRAAFDIKSGPEDIDWDRLSPRFNIAPTQEVLIVVSKEGERHAEIMRWGLIPFWTRGLKDGRTPVDARGKTVNTPINARAETIESTKSFSDAFKKRRCLVPADGFYEWQGPKGARRPMYITLRSGNRSLWRACGEPGEYRITSGFTPAPSLPPSPTASWNPSTAECR